MIWLVHLIYSAVGFALCYNYVILNYCIGFAVLPCVRLFLNSCLFIYLFVRSFVCLFVCFPSTTITARWIDTKQNGFDILYHYALLFC